MLSVVIPAFNEQELIVKCIHSVIAEFGNTTYEIIVVDNGSTDSTRKIAKLAGAKVITESRKGVTRARQTGFNRTKYDLVAFIDADSELPPKWLDYALAAINRPHVVAASGPVIYREMRWYKRIVTSLFYTIGKLAHYFAPMLQGGNFILRKDALKKAGGFNTEIDFYGEDTDSAVRLSKVGRVRFDLSMWVYTSSRRMDEEGMMKVGMRYIMNYVWIWLSGKPWSTGYHDHRPE